jgi:HPt (histidine-containing phosphotransfer) domain-containing protein
MSEALGRLWTKFLPEIEQRLELLETAARSLEAGHLAEDDREAAHQAAHKLAGVLGTFGLHRGTDLARQAEIELESGIPAEPGAFCARVSELRSLIVARK